MIDHIDEMLRRWGRWVESGPGVDLSLPHCDPFYRLRAGSVGDESYADEQSEWVDPVIAKLGREPRVIVYQYYARDRSYREIGAILRRSPQTIMRRLDAIHAHLDHVLAVSRPRLTRGTKNASFRRD